MNENYVRDCPTGQIDGQRLKIRFYSRIFDKILKKINIFLINFHHFTAFNSKYDPFSRLENGKIPELSLPIINLGDSHCEIESTF